MIFSYSDGNGLEIKNKKEYLCDDGTVGAMIRLQAQFRPGALKF